MRRQQQTALIGFFNRMSAFFTAARSVGLWGSFLLMSLPVLGQSYVMPQGGEFSVLGPLKGEQLHPALCLSSSRAVAVWEDNVIERNNSMGIGFATLDPGAFLKTSLGTANKVPTYDQEKPQVAMLQNGQFIVAWQCRSCIYTRIQRNGAFYGSDIRLNTYTTDQNVDPAVTALTDGSAVVVWSSYCGDPNNSTRDMWDIYARKISATGVLTGKSESKMNFQRAYSQRNPAITTLANGNFVVTWISENQRRGFFTTSDEIKLTRLDEDLDVYARVFNSSLTPLTDEIEVNSGTNACAGPAIAALSDGGFSIVWSEKDSTEPTNSWDVLGRSFSASGAPTSAPFKINTHLFGDQNLPKIAAAPSGCLVVWNSLGQDGDKEGVYGRFLTSGSSPAGDEFRVNTTTRNRQLYPAVAWNGADRFLVTWSSMVLDYGFDLFGQVYILNANP